jgi:hypothetical protein
MPIGLPTASLRIADLLGDPYLFAIPAYQRPYSWSLEEAGQLLDDILAAAGVDNPATAEPEYFLGSVLLLSSDGDDSIPVPGPPRVFEIIDGQQRLVTLLILASVLRDLDESETREVAREIGSLVRTAAPIDQKGRSSYRIQLRDRHQKFLELCVLDEDACEEMPDTEAIGEAERRVLEIREAFINELLDLDHDRRQALVHYLKSQCYVVLMMTADIDRAHRMFLVLNGRGKPLTRHDILKAEILSGVPAAMADRSLAAWDATAERLDEQRFDAFFSHVRAIHGYYRPQVIAGIRAIIAEVGGAQAFIERVFEPLASAYHELLSPAHNGPQETAGQIRRSLAYLDRLNGSEWTPAAMVAFSKLAHDPSRLAVELAEIERFAHVLRLLCLGSGKRVRRFAEVIEALQSGHSLTGDDGPCRLSREERRAIAYNLRDLHGRNQMACKLTLLRLNDELSGSFHDVDHRDFNVEHILPQRIGVASPWRVSFPDAQEREDCTQSLGNLLLVTPSQNDRARNQEFGRKQEIYAETREGPLAALAADVVTAEAWLPHEIRAREAKLIQLLDRVWRTDILKEVASSQGPQQQGKRRKLGAR